MAATAKRVCVTGAGGFVASWLVKCLLSKGYVVHGTLREPGNPKNDHLHKLENSENLKLFKADVLSYDDLYPAIIGCSGVFHVASPVPSTIVPNPEADLIEPAVNGTLNVLKACVEAKVERVVVVSAGAAVCMNPKWPEDKVMDETCWSDKEYCKNTQNWYSYSKTEAEMQAVEFAKKTGMVLVTNCPSLVLGPILQSASVNASSLALPRLLKGGYESMENKPWPIVDVRDVADALILAYEKAEAEGRYICTAFSITTQNLVEKLRTIYPHYSYPKNFTEVAENTRLSSEKLQRLGWKFRPLEETLIDSVQSYVDAGLLDSK